jgi:hypothetical protein
VVLVSGVGTSFASGVKMSQRDYRPNLIEHQHLTPNT